MTDERARPRVLTVEDANDMLRDGHGRVVTRAADERRRNRERRVVPVGERGRVMPEEVARGIGNRASLSADVLALMGEEPLDLSQVVHTHSA